MSEQVKLSPGARADIRRDAERNCEGATVADTIRLLDDYDALAQRCRGLEAENVRQAEQFKDWQASHHANYVAAAEQRDTLRDEVEALRKTIAEIYAQVDGNISETVRDCVNGIGNVQDIYGYCDRIEEIIAAAMAEKEPACAATAGATPEA